MRSKWNKHKILRMTATLRAHLPECSPYKRTTLHKMLKRHRIVYAKPDNSSLGYGVIRIESGAPYILQSGTRRIRCKTLTTLSRTLQSLMKKRPYILQQGIELMTYNRRRFDLRVMVQRSKTGQWHVTGDAARLAPARQIITNISAGGSVVPLSGLLPDSISTTGKHDLRKKCEKIALTASQQLARHLPNLRESGVDLAIDRTRRIWILELNTRPDTKMFNRLADRSIIEKINRFRSE
jgi:glutathione synthase/RimK-type ligase-like ATP-grasp enzyme